MDINKLTQKEKDAFSLSAQIGIDAVLSETIGKTHILIQEEVIEKTPELVENPFISEANLLVGLLMTQVRFGTISTIISEGGNDLASSKFDISSFFDFTLLGSSSQTSFILELCWLQAMRMKSRSYKELQEMMLKIFSKTWREKQTLFKVIDPKLLRIHYKKVDDSGRHKKIPTNPNVLVTT